MKKEERCGKELLCGEPYEMTIFRCGRPKGHRGWHKEEGEENGIKYNMRWEDKKE